MRFSHGQLGCLGKPLAWGLFQRGSSGKSRKTHSIFETKLLVTRFAGALSSVSHARPAVSDSLCSVSVKQLVEPLLWTLAVLSLHSPGVGNSREDKHRNHSRTTQNVTWDSEGERDHFSLGIPRKVLRDVHLRWILMLGSVLRGRRAQVGAGGKCFHKCKKVFLDLLGSPTARTGRG